MKFGFTSLASVLTSSGVALSPEVNPSILAMRSLTRDISPNDRFLASLDKSYAALRQTNEDF